MSDVERYIGSRKASDPEFAEGFEEGYKEFEFGVLLRQALVSCPGNTSPFFRRFIPSRYVAFVHRPCPGRLHSGALRAGRLDGQIKATYFRDRTQEEAGLTQEQLARLMHTKKTAISRLENRAGDIRLSTLRKAARALGKELVLSLK